MGSATDANARVAAESDDRRVDAGAAAEDGRLTGGQHGDGVGVEGHGERRDDERATHAATTPTRMHYGSTTSSPPTCAG